MNLRDIVIIYLACGAPFAVYYFLQNRRTESGILIWLKTLLSFVLWIPFAVSMVARNSWFTKLYSNGFDDRSELDAAREAALTQLRKFFEGFATEPSNRLSVFEVREVFDRYVGLTDEIAYAAPGEPLEAELFSVSNHNAKKVGEACLDRRNRVRLSFHQKLAARDLARLAARFGGADARDAVTRLAALVGDDNLGAAFADAAARNSIGEEEIWKSEERRSPSGAAQGFKVLATATANSSAKD